MSNCLCVQPKSTSTFPGLVVHATCARAFLAVVEKAVQTQPIKAELLGVLGMDNFDKVFDGSVYASGLRMLRSRKPADKDKDPAWVTVQDSPDLNDLSLDDNLETAVFSSLNGNPVTRIAESPSASASSSSSSSAQVRTNQESHTVIVRQEHLDTLKAGLGTVLMYRLQEILSFKNYAKSLVIELDDMYCPGVKRKHTSNRSYLCSSPQCSDNPAATVKTALGVFPGTFKELVERLLQPSIPQIPQVSQTAQEPEPKPQELPVVMDELVSPCVAKQRFDHHNEYFPGSAELECVRRNNILVSRVVKDSGSGMPALDGIICVVQLRTVSALPPTDLKVHATLVPSDFRQKHPSICPLKSNRFHLFTSSSFKSKTTPTPPPTTSPSIITTEQICNWMSNSTQLNPFFQTRTSILSCFAVSMDIQVTLLTWWCTTLEGMSLVWSRKRMPQSGGPGTVEWEGEIQAGITSSTFA
ncbi:hypothetical protein BJ741DRAFT_639797 [Chytriomyces cf. hyalinus JEL632]|nr:hypothetical protein BJ741DRAFT_639797 [Chytriomyces cf. hyalinus JEL632]